MVVRVRVVVVVVVYGDDHHYFKETIEIPQALKPSGALGPQGGHPFLGWTRLGPQGARPILGWTRLGPQGAHPMLGWRRRLLILF